MAWYLFLLAVAGGVVFAIWNYRRKAAASRAASEARFEQLFKGQAQVPAKPQPSSPAAASANEWSAPAKEPAESMRVVAVVDVESAAGAGTAGEQRFKSDILRQAGIRVVRVNPAVPPRRERIRALIIGEPQQKDG